MGVLVALDDFGTGFSSIGILKDIPINITKIDRSFVLKIEENENDRELIRNIAGFVHGFGSKICVEGIETKGMVNILREFNLHLIFRKLYLHLHNYLIALMIWAVKIVNQIVKGYYAFI